MKVLVTGGRGFVGKVLVKKLEQAHHQVHVFDVDDGDITNVNALTPLKETGFGHIFHLAACTYVPDSWLEPHKFYNVNVLGTLNVLEFARTQNCPVTFMSSYVYGTPQYNPIDEQHPLHAFNPYAQSKILAEELCRFYTKNYNLAVSILRPFNIYGPGQPSQFLIPTILNMVLSDEYNAIEVFDDRPKRDFVYIDDLADAITLMLGGAEGVFNIGSGSSHSVREIIDIAQQIAGTNKPIVSKQIERPNEVQDTVANIDKIEKTFGWKTKTSIATGLKQCIDSIK